jgi:hypothetical protein
MKLKITLNENSIKAAIKELEKYRDGLAAKNELFVNRLLDEGISVAYKHVGKYTGYIEFTKQVDADNTHCIGVLTGRNTKPFISEWRYHGGIKKVEINPIAMAEFGSGWLAYVIWNVSGVGQGTFPGQKHAFDPNGWYYVDTNGVKHHSKGELPQYPMYNADMTMLSQIDKIAREVFHE